MSINEFIQTANKKLEKQKETKEVDIEVAFVKYAKNKRCTALKLIILNKRGFPDRTVLCPKGKIFFIEFKRKNKKIRDTQSKVKKLLVGLGFKYYVCDRVGQAEQHLDKILGD